MRVAKPDIPAMTDNYKRENRICAAVILKNPAAYPKGSALEQWARLVEYLEVFPLPHDEQPSMEVARVVANRSALGYRVAVTGSLRWFEAWYIANAFEMVAADLKEELCSK